MNEGMYNSVVELSRLMSKPIQDSSFHFIVIAILIAPESFFLWTKEVVVWRCQIWRIWRMWNHNPSKWSDGLHGPDACARMCIVILEEHICHVQVGPNTSNFCFELPKSLNLYLRANGFPFRWKIHKDYTFRIPKNSGHNFAFAFCFWRALRGAAISKSSLSFKNLKIKERHITIAKRCVLSRLCQIQTRLVKSCTSIAFECITFWMLLV